MKRLSALIVFGLILTGCTRGPHVWELYRIALEVPRGYEVFEFDPLAFFEDADPYNAALYVNEDVSDFYEKNSTRWTRLMVLRGACEDRESELQEAGYASDYAYFGTTDFTWMQASESSSALDYYLLDLPNDDCLEYKVGEGEEDLAETVLPTLSFQ